MTGKEKKGKNMRDDGDGSVAPIKKIKKRRKRRPETRKVQRKRGKVVKKLKLQAPLVLTEEDKELLERLKRANIIAAMDFESLKIPKDGIFHMILRRFRQKGYTGLLHLHIFVGYWKDEVPEQNEKPDPETEGTFHIHYGHSFPRPSGTKGDQAADFCLKNFLDDLSPTLPLQNIFIISNDNGFRAWLDEFRSRGHAVFLAHNQESKILTGGAHMEWDWNEKFLPFHHLLYEKGFVDKDEEGCDEDEEDEEDGDEEDEEDGDEEDEEDEEGGDEEDEEDDEGGDEEDEEDDEGGDED